MAPDAIFLTVLAYAACEWGPNELLKHYLYKREVKPTDLIKIIKFKLK